MDRFLRAASVCIAVIMFSSAAFADSDRRFYVGVSGAYASVDDVSSGAPLEVIGGPGDSPASIGIGSVWFDDSDFAWSAFGGWRIAGILAIEAGYSDLGEADARGNRSRELKPRVAAEEWYLAVRFDVPIYQRLSANWHLAVTRASFDVAGALPLVRVTPTLPPFPFDPPVFGPPGGVVVTRVDGPLVFNGPLFGSPLQFDLVPFGAPDDETGYFWGLGLAYGVTDRIDVGLNYRRHDTQVIEIETVGIDLTYAF